MNKDRIERATARGGTLPPRPAPTPSRKITASGQESMTFLENVRWAGREVVQWWRYSLWRPTLRLGLQNSWHAAWSAVQRLVREAPYTAQNAWNATHRMARNAPLAAWTEGRRWVATTASRIATRAQKGEFDLRKPHVRRALWNGLCSFPLDATRALIRGFSQIATHLLRHVSKNERVRAVLHAFGRESLSVGRDGGLFWRWIWSRIPGRARRSGKGGAWGQRARRRDFENLAAMLRGDIPELSEQGWERALELAVDRHRLGPYLAHQLRDASLPPQHRAWLKAEANTSGRVALAQKAETMRCLTALRKAGIDPLLAKGWPLAEQLYDGAAMRHSKDIDFHIPETDLPRALQVMSAELGYIPLPGHAARMRLVRTECRAATEETNAIALIHRDGRHVELHWRLIHLQGWVRIEDIPDATAVHPLNGKALDNWDGQGKTPQTDAGTVRVLSPRAALIYLSVHGQLHLWGRMKWLLDIARLLEIRSQENLIGDLAVAERIGAGRAVRIAVALAHQVLGAPLPAGWPQPDKLEKWAIAHFKGLMARPGGTPGALEARAQHYLCAAILGEGRTQQLAALRYALWRNLRLWWAAKWVK